VKSISRSFGIGARCAWHADFGPAGRWGGTGGESFWRPEHPHHLLFFLLEIFGFFTKKQQQKWLYHNVQAIASVPKLTSRMQDADTRMHTVMRQYSLPNCVRDC